MPVSPACRGCMDGHGHPITWGMNVLDGADGDAVRDELATVRQHPMRLVVMKIGRNRRQTLNAR